MDPMDPWKHMARGFLPPKTTGDSLFERAAPTCPECEKPVVRAEIIQSTISGGLFGPYARLYCQDNHLRRVGPF